MGSEILVAAQLFDNGMLNVIFHCKVVRREVGQGKCSLLLSSGPFC